MDGRADPRDSFVDPDYMLGAIRPKQSGGGAQATGASGANGRLQRMGGALDTREVKRGRKNAALREGAARGSLSRNEDFRSRR